MIAIAPEVRSSGDCVDLAAVKRFTTVPISEEVIAVS
jgi:hypothetical protein